MRIYISIILSFQFFIGLSQSLILPNLDVREVDFRETDGYLQLATANNKYFLFDGKSKMSISGDDYISFNFQDDLNFNGNTAYYAGDSVIVGATINHLHIFDNQLLIATEDGVYISPIPLQLVGRKLFREDFKSLKNVKNIWSEKGNIIFSNKIDTDLDILFLWNPVTDQIRTISFRRIYDLSADPYGNLWIATSDGLYNWSDFSKEKKNIPHFNLSGVTLNDEEKGIYTSYNLSEKDRLEFSFLATHLSHPDDVEIYYELQKSNGLDSRDYLTSDKVVIDKDALFSSKYIFQNYESGEYNLRFYAKLKDQMDHHFLPSIRIKVEQQKISSFWWYLIGLTGVISLLLYIAIQRQNKFHSDIVNQRDKLLLENKSLRYQQKALQLQMNPHFIFNVLNSINGLIARGDNQRARKFINDFAKLMRSVLNQSRSDLISLDREVKYLRNYLQLESMSRGDKFDFEILLDPHLEDDMMIKPMMIQPFVENAIIHGFQKLEHRGKVSIKLSLENDQLQVIIEDNGVGRNEQAISDHKSVGLQVVTERLGTGYSYTFEDLKNLDGSNAGTRVILNMSIK